MKFLTKIRDWLMAPIARQLAERNGLLDMRNHILSGKLTDAEWIRLLNRRGKK